MSVVGQRIFNRETRENRESLYGLFFLVRAVPVVRGLEKTSLSLSKASTKVPRVGRSGRGTGRWEAPRSAGG